MLMFDSVFAYWLHGPINYFTVQVPLMIKSYDVISLFITQQKQLFCVYSL